MKTRYGISPWVSSFPESRRPAYPRVLRGEYDADVVVIGGGLTGCAIAYGCAIAGMRPWVLDADRIGQAATGRSSGVLLPNPGPAFRDIVAAHGLRAGRKVFEAWRRAALDAAALLRRQQVRCGLEPRDVVTAAIGGDEKTLRREFDARVAAGLTARWFSRAQLRSTAPLEAAAYGVHDGFAIDPYRACVGLATAAVKRGARIFERSAATKIRAGRHGVEITLAHAVIRTPTVVVATGTATREFASLRRHFTPRQAYLVLTEPVPTAMRKQLFSRDSVLQDGRTPQQQLRWTADDRVLIAGADQDEPPLRSRDAVLRQRTGQLMYQTLTMFPAISGLQPEYGWEANHGETTDGLPYIGAHRNFPRHLFALGGGYSLTAAFLAARIVVRALRGEAQKGDEVFGWTR